MSSLGAHNLYIHTSCRNRLSARSATRTYTQTRGPYLRQPISPRRSFLPFFSAVLALLDRFPAALFTREMRDVVVDLSVLEPSMYRSTCAVQGRASESSVFDFIAARCTSVCVCGQGRARILGASFGKQWRSRFFFVRYLLLARDVVSYVSLYRDNVGAFSSFLLHCLRLS